MADRCGACGGDCSGTRLCWRCQAQSDSAAAHSLNEVPSGAPLDDDDRRDCPECGPGCCEMQWVTCDSCEDGYDGHECGEDCCACLYPEENVPCSRCDGECGWWTCLGRCWDKNGSHAEVRRV